MDRTSALDSAFLQLDGAHAALHIASLAIFEGPPPTRAEVIAALTDKLPAAPRLRQRLLTVPLSWGRPVWVDDAEFTIARHVRHLRVPTPGGDRELRDLVGQLLSEPLPRDRPLWQDVVLDGLTGNRWALLTKVHHTMVDGIAGTDLLTSMLDPAPVHEPAGQDDFDPGRAPGSLRLMLDAVQEQAGLRSRELLGLPRTAVAAARHPRETARAVRRTGRGLAGFARAALPTGRTSLVGPLGRDRAFWWTELDLGDALGVRERLGGTINDVVLAAVTRAFRDLEISRGEQPDPHSIRCLVPVSVRRPGSMAADNEVSALLLTLPVELEDPRDRLNEVAVRMLALKESHEADAGKWVTSVADAVPPAVLATFLHLAFRLPHRNLTTVVTNVPGPSTTLYLAGRRLLATYPYVPIADRLRTGVAVTSYDGRLLIGITTDRDSTHDGAVLVEGLEAGFAELVALARTRRRKAFR